MPGYNNRRAIPPVQIDWGTGFNEELCKFLEDFKNERPSYNDPTSDNFIDVDKAIQTIKKYGRVKEDKDGAYDSLYMFEKEAAIIIRILTYHMVDLYTQCGRYDES